MTDDATIVELHADAETEREFARRIATVCADFAERSCIGEIVETSAAAVLGAPDSTDAGA